MAKWWRRAQRPDPGDRPAPCPPRKTKVELPDPAVAQDALKQSEKVSAETEDLEREVRGMLEIIKTGRERNGFAGDIIDLIRHGR